MPFLQDREVFGRLVEEIGRRVAAPSVMAPEARAFLFASPLLVSGCGVTNVIPVRKKGKLPFSGDDLQSLEIVKEYGPDNLCFRKSDIAAGKAEDGIFHVTVLDDVLATGGTALGIAESLAGMKIPCGDKEYGVKVDQFIFIVELDSLKGRERLEKMAPVSSIAHV
jgi:adenine phosphoribosyltransferase